MERIEHAELPVGLVQKIAGVSLESLCDALKRPQSEFLLSVFDPRDVLSRQLSMIRQELLRPTLCRPQGAYLCANPDANVSCHPYMLAIISARDVIYRSQAGVFLRYRLDDLGRPWPLSERLWEARRGLWIGAVTYLAFITIIGIPIIACLAFWFSVTKRAQPINLIFWLVWRCKLTILAIGSVVIFQSWMRDLEVLNGDSETFEQLTLRRLLAIERRLWPVTDEGSHGNC